MIGLYIGWFGWFVGLGFGCFVWVWILVKVV